VILRPLHIALVAIFILLSGGIAQAIERFDIDIYRDTSFLPYRLVPLFRNDNQPDRIPINTHARVMTVARDGGKDGMAISVYNGKSSAREPAVFSTLPIPSWRGKDQRIDITVNDWRIYRDSLLGRKVICGCGYGNDTAWAFRLDPATGEKRKTFLLVARDSAGRSDISATPFINLISDYDYDGRQEMILYFDQGAGRKPRVLFCLELETMQLQWSLPMASELVEDAVYDCNDSLRPAIMLATYPSAQGVTDAEFSDSYGYLVKIDGRGSLVRKRIISGWPFCVILRPAETPGQFYLIHSLLSSDPDSVKDGTPVRSYLSKINADCAFLKTISLRDFAASVWLQPYKTLSPALYVFQQDDVIRVYDADLNTVAESNRLDKIRAPIYFKGPLRLPGQSEESFVFGNGIYTGDFKQLLVFPFTVNSCEVASVDSNGAASTIVLCGGGVYINGRIERKSFRDLATIFYVDNQKYILMAVTALVVTSALTNFYRRRTKRNLSLITQQKREIESTHAELEKAHEELKKAQSKIIAQEKYLQAKSIAGGFAHEIRNALFPAEGAIHNLSVRLSKSGITDDNIERSVEALRTATTRAIQLTEVISSYTRLETPLPTERIPIAQVIGNVLERNASTIEAVGARILTEGSETCTIAANPEHLQAVFNNLLVNALDALTKTSNPCIMIVWSEDSRTLRVRFSDNGSGIPEDHINRVFEPFYSTKPYKGTGLGLSIVKKIIELYGGNITVASEMGRGTVFEIEFKKSST
jgi:signal transduction histidine kinase